jgi:hypothetical protein
MHGKIQVGVISSNENTNRLRYVRRNVLRLFTAFSTVGLLPATLREMGNCLMIDGKE